MAPAEATSEPTLTPSTSSLTEGSASDDDTDAVCRICLEGCADEPLISPCGCRGTQAKIHFSCLNEWRRHEVARGNTRSSSMCTICGVAYASSAGKVPRPMFGAGREFAMILAETVGGITFFLFRTKPQSLGLLIVLATFQVWMRCLIFAFAPSLPLLIWMLYLKGLKISVLGFGERLCLGITSFGPPVEGLSSGMLLVSLRAGGPFRGKVLYVLDHDDSGSLAVILNSPEGKRSSGAPLSSGGPVPLGEVCIHGMQGLSGSRRLFRGEDVFVSRGAAEIHAVERAVTSNVSWGVIFEGVSSWGPHQLEGEVRQGVWGWIPPAHVKLEDVLTIKSPDDVRLLWERLRQSPHMDVFVE